MIDSIIVVRQSLSYFWHAVVSFVLVYWIGVVSLLKQLCSKTNNEIKGSLPLIIPGVKHEVVAIVTGGCSGIGFCVARHLAGAGVHVIIASKNKDHGALAVDVVTNERPEAKVEYMEMDLESNQSVRRFVARFLEKKLPLQILINDAGVMFPPCEMTMATANDAQFAINYLGHFLLSLLLLDHMKLTAGPTNWGRIINLASSVHLVGTMDIDALLCRKRLSCHASYARSKLAVVMSTMELNKRLRAAADGGYISVNTLHPGVVETPLFRHLSPINKLWMWPLKKLCFMSADEAARNILMLALSPDLDGVSGHYYDVTQRARPNAMCEDACLRERLWEESCRLVNVAS